ALVLGIPPAFGLVGATATPHVRALSMRYASDPGPAEGALVRMFVQNQSASNLVLGETTFNGRTAANLMLAGEWSWHDTPSVRERAGRVLPAGALTVFTFNANRKAWWSGKPVSVGNRNWLTGSTQSASIAVGKPKIWFSAINTLGTRAAEPKRMVAWLENRSGANLEVIAVRLWLPKPSGSPSVFFPSASAVSVRTSIPSGELGFVEVPLEGVAPGYGVVEALTNQGSIWAHLRLRVERFDIGSGWPGQVKGGQSALTAEPYLKLLRRLNVTSANIDTVPGYSDRPELVRKYPIRAFNRMADMRFFGSDERLDLVHGVEFLGEPQLDAKPPQEVWAALRPYASSSLPTTVTNSDEATWRFYAGLSDFPHYDAYRVTAPAADDFRLYRRWGGEKVAWGAPLETIGDMCVSLREMSRPAATAVWSQGPHDDWGRIAGRQRTAPTPSELRSQAYHALATRVTSLYWFNPSLRSVVKFRDLIDPMERIGREIRIMEPTLIEGAAYRSRLGTSWHLRSLVAPDRALLFALDVAYRPDPVTKTFVFGPPRAVRFAFDLPLWLRNPKSVVRFDADGAREVAFRVTPTGVVIEDQISEVATYVTSLDRDIARRIGLEVARLKGEAEGLGFDPARSDGDFEVLRSLAP
ncbi:MAG: hypothetical protein ACOYON_04900, partial [Fimbriimonas sp.]